MIKTTLKIDGMMCGMCESHMNEVIRKNFKVKKVSSPRSISSLPCSPSRLSDSTMPELLLCAPRITAEIL